ncbi:serine/threonine-protein phosphatase 2A regulatory subunit B'' subunit alpha-like isoform X2 [Anneissia japonica]|uniref:serine/threonine-protein phosphatase 2A regulatory subunit B'' subunit alpha-like isoform X2 n=1 Tax=Anneissia japonica TaxID=1529436 RepID=UPI001425639E|nr:serine/threonine-protein phosphatase 2A regulatory subunit B'' subunit alpha-like isoform X2 [Anneissia japonica]
MQTCPQPAPYELVFSSRNLYERLFIDQRPVRIVHHFQKSCPLQRHDPQGRPCDAVHFGFCTDVYSPADLILDVNRNCVIIKSSRNAKLFEDRKAAEKNSQPVNVPRFYFPYGRPVDAEVNEKTLEMVSEVFRSLPSQIARKQDMDEITLACGCPKYWRALLFQAAGGKDDVPITEEMFVNMWRRITSECHDDASRLFRLLAKPKCNYISSEDWYPLIQDVVDTHPGLTFLQDAPEFHSRYIHTVIARIIYVVNRSWTGKITLPEFRRSNLLSVIQLLEEDDDINQITDFFSYEHFYVIYCKFWELDSNHDLFIDKKDLSRHNEHALSSRIIDSIFSHGSVLSSNSVREGLMSYTEFVWFLLSEEDKKTPMSIEYWFRCMDIDGDGYLSMYELQYFYEEQLAKMEGLGIETLPFEDCLCQMLDLVKPLEGDRISLRDLKACKLGYIFFDTFFNLEKYLDHEQRDPFSNIRSDETDLAEPSDWEKYAAEEYEMLVAEEASQEQSALDATDVEYQDDFEQDEDEDDEAIMSIDEAMKKLAASEPPESRTWNLNNNSERS